jgi:hypothetical protein
MEPSFAFSDRREFRTFTLIASFGCDNANDNVVIPRTGTIHPSAPSPARNSTVRPARRCSGYRRATWRVPADVVAALIRALPEYFSDSR